MVHTALQSHTHACLRKIHHDIQIAIDVEHGVWNVFKNIFLLISEHPDKLKKNTVCKKEIEYNLWLGRALAYLFFISIVILVNIFCVYKLQYYSMLFE